LLLTAVLAYVVSDVLVHPRISSFAIAALRILPADLADGSTYYFFQEENDLFGNDEVVLVLAETGEVLYLQSLDGVLYTESEIGEMADRIGEMADRIVYTEELVVETEYLIVDVIFYTQDSVLEFVDMLSPLDLV
jgi:hypothetical protein